MAMPREDNSVVSTRQNDLIDVLLLAASVSREAMASRRDVRMPLSCFGLLIVGFYWWASRERECFMSSLFLCCLQGLGLFRYTR